MQPVEVVVSGAGSLQSGADILECEIEHCRCQEAAICRAKMLSESFGSFRTCRLT